MFRHLHWYHAIVIAVLALVGLSVYHQAHRPATQGYILAEALRYDGFDAYLRPALPIIDHEPAGVSTPDNADQSAPGAARPSIPKGCTFFERPSEAGHPEVYKLLDNELSAKAIIKTLDRTNFYHDYSIKQVQDEQDTLRKIPPELLLNQIITADVDLLEKIDDLPSCIKSALLLTALHPIGAVGCIKSPTQTVYLLTLADDNAPGNPDYILTLYAFNPAGQELWTGSLEVPRAWSPDQTFALLDNQLINAP